MRKNMRWVMLIVALLLALPLIYAAQDEYKPYLHKPNIPEGPKVKLYGSYTTSLFPGAATYSYPLDFPKGTNNLQPTLGLSYSSQGVKSRPGIVGAGWSLTQNYIYRDTNSTLSSTNDDEFKLVLQGTPYDLVFDTTDGLWHTDIESFLKVQNTSGGQGNYTQYWFVTSKDGTQYRFGFTPDAELLSNAGYSYAIKWSLDTITDTFNNSIFYAYLEDPFAGDQGTVYLSEIVYNNDRARNISFQYEAATRPDLRFVYETGNKLNETRRLSNISILAGGSLVRKYQLGYNDLDNEHTISSLSTVRYLGSDQSQLHNITFDYYPTSNTYTKFEASWQAPIYFEASDSEDKGVRIDDLNNDGYIDIVQLVESGNRQVWLNNHMDGWTDSPGWVPPIPLWAIDDRKIDNGLRFVDLNLDGFSDIILQSNNDNGERRYTYLSSGNGTWTDASSTWNIPTGYNIIEKNVSEGLEFVDFDGDGRTDILIAFDDGVDNTKKAFRNNGNGWTDVTSAWTIPVHFMKNKNDTGARTVDLNGDGLIDIIQGAVRDNVGNVHTAWLNNGAGWTETSYFAPPIGFTANTRSDNGTRFMDVNGDGLPDIVHGFFDGVDEKMAWINNASGWVRNDSWIAPISFSYDRHNLGRRLPDVNGDGFGDIIVSFDGSPGTSNKSTHIRNSVTPFLLKKVTNEYGGVVEVHYNQSTRYNNTGDDTISDVGFNTWVVDVVKQNNSMDGAFAVISNVSYNYTGGLFDYPDREFRGFKQVLEFRPDNGTTAHFFYQTDGLKGKEYRTEVYDDASRIFSIANTTYNSTLVRGYYKNFMQEESSSLYDGNATNPKVTNVSYSYDDYGNLLEKHNKGDTTNVGDDKFERYTYVSNTSAWIFKLNRYQLLDINGTKVRETLFGYDQLPYGSVPLKGSLTKQENWLNGSAANPVSTKTYTSYGLVATETDPLGHTTTYSYDNTSTYPVKIVNVLDQPTFYEYDPGTGNLNWEEKNTIRKNYYYDVFARPIKEIMPYDNEYYPTKAYNYTFDGSAPESIKVSMREHSNVTSDVYYFYDGNAQLMQLKSPADSDQQVIKNIYYDQSGRVAEEDNPYFDSFSTSLATPVATANKTRYSYDTLARIRKVTSPDGTNKTVNYDHWTISDYDENSHQMDYVLDGQGRIALVSEYNNDPLLGTLEQYNTSYAYDTADSLVGIKDSMGNNFNFTFDTLGRKTVLDDPDLGHWEYTYDLAGNLIKQNDSRQRVASMTYDKLNRVLNKTSTNLNIYFGYDQQYFGTLSNITGNYTFRYTYDDRMRPIKEEMLLRGNWIEVNDSRDSMNRIVETRSIGTDLDYYYNHQGKINQSPGFIESTTYNSFGSPLTRTYNNTRTTTFSYNNTNNRPLKIITGNAQDLTYKYDKVDNVEQISDTAHSLTYRMGYDFLDRLTNTTINNDVYRYSYNPIGNLIHMSKKNETLRYNYGSLAHAPDFLVTSKTAIQIHALRNTSNLGLNYTFNFTLFNELNSSLTEVNWTADWGDGMYTTGSVATLAASSLSNITTQHNYTRGGDYTVNVSAVAAGASDQQKLNLKFGIQAYDLFPTSRLITNFTIQFDIKNDLIENVSNVNYTCAGVISPTILTFTGGELKSVVLNQNYTSAGKQTLTCKADSPHGNESKTIKVSIPALVLENVNITSFSNKREVYFTIKNYYSPLVANWTLTSDGQTFTNTTTIATGASVEYNQNITYSADGIKSLSISLTSGGTAYDQFTASFDVDSLVIQDYQRINKTGNTSIFSFKVTNKWPSTLETSWSISDPSIASSSTANLTQNESLFVFVEDSMTQGLKSPVIRAYSNALGDRLYDLFRIKIISIESQQTLLETDKRSITELRTKSTGESTPASWSFDTGQGTIQSTQPLTLNDTQDTFVFIENTYTTNGIYPTKATINSTLYSDNSTGVAQT